MGVAKGLEQRLEGLVEGFFTRVFRSGLQPIEVGRKILREMADGKTLSVNKVYAPNEFRVLMGPDDYSRFSQMEAGLRKEFTDLVIDAAKQNRWNLMGLPEITFEESDGMGKGEFKVDASFAASEHEPRHVATKEPDRADPSSTGAISTDTASELGLANSTTPQLVLLDEKGKPSEKISVTREPITIGRMSNNDVVLPDANVSRTHAELKQRDGGWILVDLGSTNGTTVNGKLATEHDLKDGDRIGFGTSEMIFRIGEGA